MKALKAVAKAKHSLKGNECCEYVDEARRLSKIIHVVGQQFISVVRAAYSQVLPERAFFPPAVRERDRLELGPFLE